MDESYMITWAYFLENLYTKYKTSVLLTSL